MVANL